MTSGADLSFSRSSWDFQPAARAARRGVSAGLVGWLAAMGAAWLATTPGWAAERRVLPGHVPVPVRQLSPKGRLPSDQILPLALGLPLRHPAELEQLLVRLYDPASPDFRRFLTVDQFTGQFGPTALDYEQVVQFARDNGLKVETRHSNRILLEVSGPVAAIERAFGVALRVYRHPTENRDFFAPDRDPTISGAAPLLHVEGLDNFVAPRALLRPSSVTTPQTGSGPGGSYRGKDFRAAYAPGVLLTGAGERVGLLEFSSGFSASDITRYENEAGLALTPARAVLLNGYNGSLGGASAEVSLDIEDALSMAPGLVEVVVYEGKSTDSIMNRMATDNLARQLSASWTYGIDPTTIGIFQQFAAQGQSFFNASGDSDAYPPGGGVASPTDSPYLTIVGGTTLSTSGAGGAWSGETVWNWGGGTGSSGGVSAAVSIPSWQQWISMKNNLGSTDFRNLPDVALTADNIHVIFGGGQSGTYGGTSCAAPLWAGFTALINQRAAGLGNPPVGFLNPALYALARGSNYPSTFHDVTQGNNFRGGTGAHYSAAPGFDLCTGLGTPKGQALIDALAGAGSEKFSLSAAPATVTLTAGGSVTVVANVLFQNGFKEAVDLAVSGLPAGVSASISPTNDTGASVVTLSATGAAPAGSAALTISGSAGVYVGGATVQLNVTPATPGAAPVDLTSLFDIAAVSPDGSRVSGGGMDGSGNAYSGALLPVDLYWNGNPMPRWPASALDAIQCAGQMTPLAPGAHSALNLLAAAVQGAQKGVRFTVTYTDGSTSTFTQNVSDWASPQGYPGETTAFSMPYRNQSDGQPDLTTPVSLYGYSFGLDTTKSVRSVTLPFNKNVIVLSMALSTDFALFAPTTPAAITAGGASRIFINAAPLDGSGTPVSLSVAGLPSGLTASWNPAAAASNSFLTLSAAPAIQPGPSTLTVLGALNGMTHSFSISTYIQAPIPGAAALGLGGSFNSIGIVDDGVVFGAAGGLGRAGEALSAEALGPSPAWNGCVFPLGAPDGLNAVQCAGQELTLPAGQYPAILLLAVGIHGAQSNQQFTIHYTDGATTVVTQSFSGLDTPRYFPGEFDVASLPYVNLAAGDRLLSRSIHLYGYSLAVDDSKTLQSVDLPNNPNVSIFGMVLADVATPVPLDSIYNRVGIGVDGSPTAVGLDGAGNTYSEALIGSSQFWRSTLFHMGVAGVSNCVTGAGQVVNLPPGRFTVLNILAAAAGAAQSNQRFVVTYADGSQATLTQSLSSWTKSQAFAGESIVAAMPYSLNSRGEPAGAVPPLLYGYALPLDNSKNVLSVQLPNNPQVVVFSLALGNVGEPVSLNSAFNRAGIYTDGASFAKTGGLDSAGHAYAAELLGNGVTWRGLPFLFGPVNANDAVAGGGAHILLPPGHYSALSILGTAVNGAQAALAFRVVYSDGTSTSTTQGVSDWTKSSNYRGESNVLSSIYGRSYGGGRNFGMSPNVYGYSFGLDPQKSPGYLALPATANFELLAATLANATLAAPEPPIIRFEPQWSVLPLGGAASFTVGVIGSPPLTFQWFKDGAALADAGDVIGSSTALLGVSPVGVNDLGDYWVVVENPFGAVTSSVATLYQPTPPTFVVEPASVVVTNGGVAIFLAQAAGSPPLTFQWQRNGAALTNGGEFSGAHTATLAVSPVTTNVLGQYQLLVSNPLGSAVSAAAALAIGSRPFSIQSSFNPAGVTFSWQAVGGESYQLQYATNLANALWTSIGPPVLGASANATVTDTNRADSWRFYRILASP